MSPQPVDYAALAKQAGATSSVPPPAAAPGPTAPYRMAGSSPAAAPIDYAAMAKQAGSTGYTPPPASEEPGMLSRAWRYINTPLIPEGRAESEARQDVSAPPTMETADHPIWTGIKRGIEGTYADTLSTARSLISSPASLALAVAGALGRVPGAVGSIAKAVQGLGAAGYAAKGASDIADISTQPGNMSPDDLQKLFFDGAQVAGGAAGTADAIAGSSPKTGVAMMNRVIKPGLKNFERGQNPGQAVIDEGLTGNSTADLAQNIKSRYRMVGQQIGDTLTTPAAAAQKLDVHTAVTQPIDDAMTTAQNAGRADLYTKLQTIKDQLTKNFAPDANGDLQPIGPITKNKALVDLTPEEVTDIKRQVGDVTKWEGTPFRDEFNQVKAAIYGNLKDAVEQAVPDVAPLNARYRMLKNAGAATDRTAAVQERQNAVSLPDYILTAGSVPAGLAVGHPIEGALTGAALATARHALSSPAIQTRAAQFLAHEGPAAGAAGAALSTAQPDRKKKKR
jgi:hypothetical protein